MSLIKKIDVDKHFAAKRAMRLGRTGPLSPQSTRIQPVAVAKNAPGTIAADSDKARVFTVLRNTQA